MKQFHVVVVVVAAVN